MALPVYLADPGFYIHAGMLLATGVMAYYAYRQAKAAKGSARTAEEHANATSEIARQSKRMADIQESQVQRPSLVCIERAKFEEPMRRRQTDHGQLPTLHATFKNPGNAKSIVVHRPIPGAPDAIGTCGGARVVFRSWQPGTGKDRVRVSATVNPGVVVVEPGEYLHLRIALELEAGRMESGPVQIRLKCDPALADGSDLAFEADLVVSE